VNPDAAIGSRGAARENAQRWIRERPLNAYLDGVSRDSRFGVRVDHAKRDRRQAKRRGGGSDQNAHAILKLSQVLGW
jgi:hypothetical protein